MSLYDLDGLDIGSEEGVTETSFWDSFWFNDFWFSDFGHHLLAMLVMLLVGVVGIACSLLIAVLLIVGVPFKLCRFILRKLCFKRF